MAYGTLTVVREGYPKRIGHGIKSVQGKFSFPATNSACAGSAIEKYFRRITSISFNVKSSNFAVNFLRSTTHKAGLIYLLGGSGTGSGFCAIDSTAVTSGTFNAFGA